MLSLRGEPANRGFAVREVLLRENPRSKFPCECGSGRRTLWLLEERFEDGKITKRDLCFACKKRVWLEATDWVFERWPVGETWRERL